MAIAVAGASWLSPTRADAQGAAPSYGRVEGDVTWSAGVGAVVASGGPRAAGDLRLRYLDTAGLFATYEDASLWGGGVDPRRVVAAGLEVRPLFLYRWLQGHESHRAWLDLTLDSLGLEVGTAWVQPVGASLASSAAIQVGLGAELPVGGAATGPWVGLHGGVRWSERALANGAVATARDQDVFLAITVAWHQVVVAHVVDLGDEAPR